jgi:PAS domain S-box-containing protein
MSIRPAPISLLLVAILAVGSGLVLSSLVDRSLLDRERAHLETLARREAETLNLESFLDAPPDPGSQDRWRLGVARLSRAVPAIGDVTVWRRDGTVLWAEDQRLIGQRVPHDPERERALSGLVTVQLRPRRSGTWLDQVVASVDGRTRIEVFVPVAGKAGPEVLGILRFSQSAEGLLAAMWRLRIAIWAACVVNAGILGLVLLSLFRRLRQSRAQRDRTLREYTGRLAHEIAKRARALETQTERLTQLAALIQIVTGSLHTQRVFDEVVRGALDLLQVAMVRLWVVEPSGEMVPVASVSSPRTPVSFEGASLRLATGQDRVGRVVATREAYHAANVTEDPFLTDPAWWEREGIVSALTVPLLLGDAALGAVVVATREPRSFSPEECQVLATLAAAAALAITKARLHEETAARLSQTEALLTVSRAVASTLDVSEITRRTCQELVRILGGDVAAAWSTGPAGSITLLGGYQMPDELARMGRQPVPVGPGTPAALTQIREPIHSGNAAADRRLNHPFFRSLPAHSILVQPMWVKEDFVGGFVIGWAEGGRQFTPDELRLVEGIARQAAVAIESARLFEAEREARRRLEASEARYRELFDNAIEAVYVLDLEGRFLTVNDAGVRTFGYDLDELLGMNLAQLVAPEGWARWSELVRQIAQGELASESFTMEIVRKDRARAVLEASARPVYRNGVPIAVQGSARDITVRRQLEHRQSALLEIVVELAAAGDPDRVLTLIGERSCQLVGADSASFALVEGKDVVLRPIHGFPDVLAEASRERISEGRAGRVVLSQVPQVSPNMAEDSRWRDSPLVTEFGYASAVEVPIVLRDAVVGVLAVFQKTPRVFSAEDIALLTSLAGYAAVALDRTGLLKTLSTRLRETETLLDVTQAVSSTHDEIETIRRVSRAMGRALGADLVGAYLADDNEVALRPIAGYHVPKDLLEAFQTFAIPVRGHRFVERAWEVKEPMFSVDAAADPRLDSEFRRVFPYRSVLFAPMLVKGEPIGGFFVVWLRGPHQFTVDEIRLVEGISGQAATFLEVARQDAQRRRAEEETRKLNAELEQRVLDRTAALAAVNKELEAFSYSVSHDLRAPIRRVNGFARALFEDHGAALDASGRQYLESIDEAARQMDALIDGMLDLARVARADVHCQEVDLTATARSIAAGLERQAPGRRVAWVVTDGVTAVGDPVLLRSALENLLGNAWKFTAKRPVARVEFGVTEIDGFPTYFVRDDGAGFDMVYAHKLFGAFQRLHRITDFEGTGIGLATVQRIVRRHGGRIWATGAVGRGATFYFTLWTEMERPAPSSAAGLGDGSEIHSGAHEGKG